MLGYPYWKAEVVLKALTTTLKYRCYMKRSHLIIIPLTIFVLVFSCLSFAEEFRVTMVYDGDTVKAETSDIVIYLMLVGIDAPEVSNQVDQKDQAFGQEAKKFLSSMILNKTVVLEGYGTVPYPDNNIISVLYLKGKNINLEMVKHGMAEVCRQHLPEGFDIGPYLRAEKEAREVKNGMWILGENYISPTLWRKLHKIK
jgi:endonuclease YncB( thermonuclease family)